MSQSWLTGRERRVEPTTHPLEEDTRASTTSSVSLTPSKLNLAIQDILNTESTLTKCKTFCRGNPITANGKKNQVVKIMTIVMIPVMLLTGMIGNIFFITINNYTDVNALRRTLLYSIDLGRVLHHLQEERDISALYLSSVMEKTKKLLLMKYPETDIAISHLPYWAAGPTLTGTEFNSKDKFLSFLNKHRYELDTLNQTVTMELQLYTTLVRTFTSWVHNAITERQSGSIWRSLVAYQEVIIAKEYMGLERALGTVFYAMGSFGSHDVYLWFTESQDVTNATFRSAKRYSTLVNNLFQENIKDNSILMGVLGRMRAEIRRNDLAGHGSVKMAQWWFNNMTLYMDILLATQNKLAVDVSNVLDERQANKLNKMIAISCVLGGVLILSVSIICAVYSLTVDIQLYSVSLAERTERLDKKKKQTDQLLFQMLPRSVARRLKCNEDIPAERFDSATVFFSDIQGFTQVCSKSSPIQIVHMLNSLYSCFDSIIAMYTVYKVETIGDAYMVASGVPKQVNHRHQAEICNMAAHILCHIQKLVIPHLPGTKFKLRIGCHTGSVVAGVVGTKMPRYCLFGETISIAAKMESLGKPGMIHITQTTYEGLTEEDGFCIEERHDPRVKDELQIFHSGEIQTYWLTKPTPCATNSESPLQESSSESDGEDNSNNTVVRGKATAIM